MKCLTLSERKWIRWAWNDDDSSCTVTYTTHLIDCLLLSSVVKETKGSGGSEHMMDTLWEGKPFLKTAKDQGCVGYYVEDKL